MIEQPKIVVPNIDSLLTKPKAKKKRDVIKNNLFNVLLSKNLSQAKLADDADLNPSHVSEIVNQKRGVSLMIALKIARALNTPVEKIFYLVKPVEDENSTASK